MRQYFPEPYERSGYNVKVELYLSNYATKGNLNGVTGIDTSKLASRTDLTSLKTKVDDLDVDKLKTVPVDLSKLRNVSDNNIVKKTVYNKLIIRVNTTITKIPSNSGLMTKTQHDSDKKGLTEKTDDVDKKIPKTSRLVKKTDYYKNIMEIENKILSGTGLTTTAGLTAKATEISIKIPDITKAALNTKVRDIDSKTPDTTGFITTPKFNIAINKNRF